MLLELLSFTGGHPAQQIGIGSLFRIGGARCKNVRHAKYFDTDTHPRQGLVVLACSTGTHERELLQLVGGRLGGEHL
jgi:hypothetical protein